MRKTFIADCFSIAVDKIGEANEAIPVIGLSGQQGAGKTTALYALISKVVSGSP